MSIDHVASFLSETQEHLDETCGVPITSFLTKFKSPIHEDLKSLMSHTIIATKDVVDRVGNYDIATPAKKQIKALINALNKIHDLPSGALLLNELNRLLANKGQKLVFSFVRDKQSSPICNELFITICDRDGKIERPLCPSFVRLPEQLPSSIILPFFSKNQQKVIYVKEPIYIVIAHELIHCTQNLSHEDVSADILAELRRNYPSIECLKTDNPILLKWCEKFFGGTNPATWPDELQAMILGFQIGTIHVSESQLLSELLQEGVCPDGLKDYKNDVLIPFGHLGPDAICQDEDSLNFTTLLSQTQLHLFANISPKKQLEIEKGPSSNPCLCIVS